MGGYYIFLNSFIDGTVFRRQNLTYKDSPRTERDKYYIVHCIVFSKQNSFQLIDLLLYFPKL